MGESEGTAGAAGAVVAEATLPPGTVPYRPSVCPQTHTILASGKLDQGQVVAAISGAEGSDVAAPNDSGFIYAA